jgi:hypothetical protein
MQSENEYKLGPSQIVSKMIILKLTERYNGWGTEIAVIKELLIL